MMRHPVTTARTAQPPTPLRLLPAAAIGIALAGLPSLAMAQDVLYTASRILVAPGVEVDAGSILVRSGKIVALGDEIPDAARQSARKVALDGVVMPGLVSAHGYLDQQGDLAEVISAVTPDLRVADAFNPYGEALELMGPQGVTAYGLAPYSLNTFAGLAAAVKPGAESGRLLREECFLKIALVQTARDQQRYPTSLMGAAELARNLFDSARDPLIQGPEVAVLRDCMSGARTTAIHANTSSELGTALDLARRYGFKPVLLGAAQAGDMIEPIAEVGASLVLAPLDLSSKQEQLELPARLEQAGVAFSFTGDAARMRWSTALAMRYGLSRRGALAAITRTPAEQLGVADHVGSLRAGRDADLLVFSGDPMDLSSRLLAVYVDGKLLTPATEVAR